MPRFEWLGFSMHHVWAQALMCFFGWPLVWSSQSISSEWEPRVRDSHFPPRVGSVSGAITGEQA